MLDLNIPKCKSKFISRKKLDFSPNVKSTTSLGEYEIQIYKRIKPFLECYTAI